MYIPGQPRCLYQRYPDRDKISLQGGPNEICRYVCIYRISNGNDTVPQAAVDGLFASQLVMSIPILGLHMKQRAAPAALTRKHIHTCTLVLSSMLEKAMVSR